MLKNTYSHVISINASRPPLKARKSPPTFAGACATLGSNWHGLCHPPTSTGQDTILVFIDKLTRMVHLAPTKETCAAEEAATLLLDTVYRQHGMRKSIVSDGDPRFTLKFWTAFHKAIGTQPCISTAFHPRTDGATERANQVVEDLLCAHYSNSQHQWDQYLWAAEFACNNAVATATGFTPFFLSYGYHPDTLLSACLPHYETTPAAHAYLQTQLQALQAARENACHERQRVNRDHNERDITKLEV